MLKVGIIGLGGIGKKRLNVLRADNDWDVVFASDFRSGNDFDFETWGCEFNTDWKYLSQKYTVDAVFVATSHAGIFEIGKDLIGAGIHCFLEKPAGRNLKEVEELRRLAITSGALVRVGLNHRFHRSAAKAKSIIDRGILGDLFCVRARYGHGGRLGYEKEWRADPEISGGGELVDQGPHLIDLSRWFLDSKFVGIKSSFKTFYWDMPVDDNVFMILETIEGQIAHLHVSCTEWRNLFSFEIYGSKGKLSLDGLGGSYGLESITHYKMLPQMGPPEITCWQFPTEDQSWRIEMDEFKRDILLNRDPDPGLPAMIEIFQVIDTIYASE